MPPIDPNTLPAPLDAYFAARDADDIAHLFTPDGVVRDEGQTHNGGAAIRDWRRRVTEAYHPRYVITAVQTTGETTTLALEVWGTFPGSPATLRQAFTLRDGLIAKLQTL